MESYSEAELKEALRAIVSMISKSEKALVKMAAHPSQHTLLTRRIQALRIAEQLILRELEEFQADHSSEES